MSHLKHRIIGSAATVTGIVVVGMLVARPGAGEEKPPSGTDVEQKAADSPVVSSEAATPKPPVPAFVKKGLRWLAEAQQENGGWGGGSHSRQDILDPHAVPTDPGTSAFTAMAFLRAGHTYDEGDHRETVRLATDYLLGVVEASPEDGPRVTDVVGTQPQAKMGQFVDTALCAQFFSRAIAELNESDELHARVARARDKCLAKIQASQSDDGSWESGGWAPVLQSSLMSNALELGYISGASVSRKSIALAREYQKGQVDGDTGAVAGEAAAGVALYASAGNMRANAAQGKAARDLIDDAKNDGRLDEDAPISEANLIRAGAPEADAAVLRDAYVQNEAAKLRAFDEQMLQGFGNNGGEEFLSYLMNSESLVIDGGEEWLAWNEKMLDRLAKVQNGDGSWSGHHCISSPVFCTAAVALCLTAERDSDLLAQAAEAETTRSTDDDLGADDDVDEAGETEHTEDEGSR